MSSLLRLSAVIVTVQSEPTVMPSVELTPVKVKRFVGSTAAVYAIDLLSSDKVYPAELLADL